MRNMNAHIADNGRFYIFAGFFLACAEGCRGKSGVPDALSTMCPAVLKRLRIKGAGLVLCAHQDD